MKNAIVIAAVLSTAGCVANVDGPAEVEGLESAIINGTPITSDPEIGFFWGPRGPCTATLIRSRAILTAAHCFDHQTDTSETANGGVFIYDNFTKERWIDGFVSLGRQDDTLRDVAVARLVSDADGAFPRGFASNFPTDPNEVIRIVGYGCGDPITNPNGVPTCTMDSDFSVKRDIYFYWFGLSDHRLTSAEAGQLNVLLQGDSGGPVFNGSGQIIFVNSGTTYFLDANDRVVRAEDRFGNVPLNNTPILNALAQLGVF